MAAILIRKPGNTHLFFLQHGCSLSMVCISFHILPSPKSIVCLGHWRFLHFHGQKSARQDRYKSVYKDSRRRRTILIRILSPMLFFFPDVHLLELEKLWTDKIIVEGHWREFMQKLVSEWTDFVLYVSPRRLVKAQAHARF